MKQMLRRIGYLVLVLGLLAWNLASAEAGAKRTLKLGTILPADNILTQNAQEFAKKVVWKFYDHKEPVEKT